MSLRRDSVLLLLLLLVAGSASQCDDIITETFDEPFVVNQRDGYDGLVRMCTVFGDYYSVALAPGATLTVTIKFTHDEGNLDLETTIESGLVLSVSRTDTDNENLEFKNDGNSEYSVYISVYLDGDRPAGQDSQVYTLTIDVTQTQCPTGEFLQNGKCDPCPAGQFKIGTDDATSCVGWAPACASGKFEAIAPSKTQDRMCRVGCPEDQYDRAFENTALAPDCQTTCLSGAEPGTKEINGAVFRVCTTCEAGKYSVAGAACTAHTVCGAGRIKSEASTATQDVTCVECDNTITSTGRNRLPIVERDGYNGIVTTCSNNADYYKVDVAPGATLNAILVFKHAEGDLDAAFQCSDGTCLGGSRSVTDTETLEFRNDDSTEQLVFIDVFIIAYQLPAGRGGQRYTLTIDVTQTRCGTGEFLQNGKCDPCPAGQFKIGTNDAVICTAHAVCGANLVESEAGTATQDVTCVECKNTFESGLGNHIVVDPAAVYSRSVTTCGENVDYYKVDVAPGATLNVNVIFKHDEGDIDIEMYGDFISKLSYSTTDNEALEFRNDTGVEDTVYIVVYMFQDRPDDRVGQVYTITIDVTQTQCGPGEFLQSGKCDPCPAGRFKIGTNDAVICAAHTVCTAGLIESEAGTATQDVTCVECKNTFESGLGNHIVVDPAAVYSRSVTTCGYNIDYYKVDVAPGATLNVNVIFKHDEGDIYIEMYGDFMLGESESTTDNETLEFRNGDSTEQLVFIEVFILSDRPDDRGGQVYTITIDVTQTQCGPGEFLQNGKCDPCPDGQFKIGISTATACTPGNACAASGIKTPATPTTDAVCHACPAGKHISSGDPLMALFGMADGIGVCETCQGNTVQPQPNSAETCRPCNDPLVANTDHTMCGTPLVSTSSAARAAVGTTVLIGGLLMMAVMA